MADYKVKFEVFEGPMDLLLYLVKKEEVDIYDVNLTMIAREFIEYVDLMREFDIEIAGEFLVMASTLMYIKSKELLPVEQQVQGDDNDENEDPRWELIRKLVEYKKFTQHKSPFTLIGLEIPSTKNKLYPTLIQAEVDKAQTYIDALPPNIYSVGRMGTYRYIDIDDIILDSQKMINDL